MANEFFENPKVALGFAVVVVAVALVASVAFQELSSDDKDAADVLVQEQSTTPQAPAPAATSYTTTAATGWSDAEDTSDDWGAPVSTAQNTGVAEGLDQASELPVTTNKVPSAPTNPAPRQTNGPIITSSAAPGAPAVSLPFADGNQSQIVSDGG